MIFDLEEVVVAADVGGTNMRVALIRGDGTVLSRREQPTPHNVGVPDELTDLISSTAHLVPAGERSASRVVVGLPGPIDYRSGKLIWAPHLPESWPDQLSESRLREEIGLPVQLANDADLAALGEAYFGAGRKYRDVAYVTISTGYGAGFVFDGQLLHATRSLGEIGHTIIDWMAWSANLPATLEDLASGSGMTRMAVERGLGALSGKEINERAHREDPEALQIWERAVSAAAAGIFNVANAFSPEVIVIGGGLGLQTDFFLALEETFLRRASSQIPPTPLVPAALGDDAGLIGATRWTALSDTDNR